MISDHGCDGTVRGVMSGLLNMRTVIIEMGVLLVIIAI